MIYLVYGGDVADREIIRIYSKREDAEKLVNKMQNTGSWENYYINEVEVHEEYKEPKVIYHISIEYDGIEKRLGLVDYLSHKRIVDKKTYKSHKTGRVSINDFMDDLQSVIFSADSQKSFLHAYRLAKNEYKRWKTNG